MTAVAHRLALGAWLGLFVLMIGWVTWLAPRPGLPVLVGLLLWAAPLLIPLRGLLRGSPLAHFWTGMLALFYFALGVADVAGAQAPAWLAWGELLLSLLLFTGGMLYARLAAKGI